MAAVRSARSHPRIAVAALAALLIAVAVTLIWASAPGQATSSGDPYAVPIAVDNNPDPTILETNITAQPATVDVGAAATSSVHAETYNGSVPGPTLIANVGDTVIVHFTNQLSEPTAIHWHGIEVPNEMDGTPLTQNMVQPGGTFLYKFKLTRPGIFWYHPHHHSSTNQVFKGLYGMIIVKDPNDDQLVANGTLPSAANTKRLVLSDTTVCKTPGSNDTQTYSPLTLPWVGPGNLPAQAAPAPKNLCEAASGAVDDTGGAKAGDYALGDIPSIQHLGPGSAVRENEGQTVLTNGKNVGGRGATQGDPPTSPMSALGSTTGDALLNVQPGQGLRLQILNASAIRYMRLRLTESNGNLVNLVRVGGEGGLLDRAQLDGGINGSGYNPGYTQGEALVPPGSRIDLVAAIPAAASGVMTLWTEDFSRYGTNIDPDPTLRFADLPTVPVMHLNVTGAVVSPAYDTIMSGGLTPTTGTPLRTATGDLVEHLPSTATALLPADGFSPQKIGKSAPVLPISLTAGAGGPVGVNGTQGTHDVADYAVAPHMGPSPGNGSTRYARLGDVLTLTVTNSTAAHHPFHLHGFSIQPVTISNGAQTLSFPDEFRDNIDIPGGYTLTFRVRLADRPKPDGVTAGGGLGRWVFHCHIFFHAELGMLSELVVLPAGLASTNGDERPNINTSTTALSVAQGATASFTGKFNDQDAGDNVALSSSVGTMTDNGGGNYTWSFPTGTASSQYVYVNGTDSSGAKVQMPVKLTITNSPPALTLPAAQTIAQGANLAFNVSATDPDTVDPLALTASGLPATATFKDNGNRTGAVSGQVTAPPGVYPVGIAVNDGKNPAVTGNVQVTVTPPVFTAAVAKKEVLRNKKITVGCKFLLASVTKCAATVRRATKQVGAASSSAGLGKALLNVGVPLNKSTRAAVARSIGGITANVALSATRSDAATPFAGQKNTKVVPARLRVITAFGAFAGRATLTKHAKRYLKALAKKIGTAKRIVCTGHPNRGSNSKATAKARGAAGCAALKAGGLKAKFSSLGSTRKHDKHLEITILR